MSRKRDTFLNECRKFFPHCSEPDAHALVWCATAFPAAGIEHCRAQLKESAQKGGGTVAGALAWADAEMYRAMQESKKV
jgi:hypothetical protein